MCVYDSEKIAVADVTPIYSSFIISLSGHACIISMRTFKHLPDYESLRKSSGSFHAGEILRMSSLFSIIRIRAISITIGMLK
jgi:hypothetical protein